MRDLTSNQVTHAVVPKARSKASMVRAEGLEPPRLAPLVPKTSVSTNSTTPASTKRGVLEGRLQQRPRQHQGKTLPYCRSRRRGRRTRSATRPTMGAAPASTAIAAQPAAMQGKCTHAVQSWAMTTALFCLHFDHLPILWTDRHAGRWAQERHASRFVYRRGRQDTGQPGMFCAHLQLA